MKAKIKRLIKSIAIIFIVLTLLTEAAIYHNSAPYRKNCQCIFFTGTQGHPWGRFNITSKDETRYNETECILIFITGTEEEIVELRFEELVLRKKCLDQIHIFPHLRESIIQDSYRPEDTICYENIYQFLSNDNHSITTNQVISFPHEETPMIVNRKNFRIRHRQAIFSSERILGIRLIYGHIHLTPNQSFNIIGKFQFIDKVMFKNDGNLVPTTFCDYQFLPRPINYAKEHHQNENSVWRYFHSPRYPAKYPDHIKCSYKFIGRPRNRVEIIFEEIYLLTGHTSCFHHTDKIIIYDGKFPDKTFIIDVLCNEKPSRKFISTGPNFFIEFEASSNRTSNGFSAKYRFIDVVNDKGAKPNSDVSMKSLFPTEFNQTEQNGLPEFALKVLDTLSSINISSGPEINNTLQENLTKYNQKNINIIYSNNNNNSIQKLKNITNGEKISLITNVQNIGTTSSSSSSSSSSSMKLEQEQQNSSNENLSDEETNNNDSLSNFKITTSAKLIITEQLNPLESNKSTINMTKSNSNSPRLCPPALMVEPIGQTIKTTTTATITTSSSSLLNLSTLAPFLPKPAAISGKNGNGRSNYDQHHIPIRGSNCDIVLHSSKSKNGTFISPLFPNSYPVRTFCRIEFQGQGRERIQINFIEFSLPSDGDIYHNCQDSDNLQVLVPIRNRYEPIETLCGDIMPKPIMSDGTRMLLEFRGRRSGKGNRGFKGEYRFVENYGIITGRQSSNGDCTFIFNGTETRNGFFHSPNFPGAYPRNLECNYLFYGETDDKISIRFTYFDVEGIEPCDEESASDYVEFSNFMSVDRKYRKWCGKQDSFSLESDGRFFRITFRTNDRFDKTGFRASYHFIATPPTTEKPRVTPVLSSSAATILNFSWPLLLVICLNFCRRILCINL